MIGKKIERTKKKETVWAGDLEKLMREKGKWNLQAVTNLYSKSVCFFLFFFGVVDEGEGEVKFVGCHKF